MKTLSTALANHLTGGVVTLATCWRVERRDGTVFRFTDHDRDLEVSGESYAAATGYARAAIGGDASLAVDETEILGILDGEAVTAEALLAGLWDGAEMRIFAVNWQDSEGGYAPLRRGKLGEVVGNDEGQFKAELRGLSQALQQPVGELYTPECRADVFDARCKLVAADWTMTGAVASTPSSTRIVAAAGDLSGKADGWFEAGILTCTDGANAGASREIVAWTQGSLEFGIFLPFPFPVVAGDGFSVTPGCDKRWVTCKTKWATDAAPLGNKDNFRGEPLVPGMDSLTDVQRA